jgi:hypothetical protein
MMMRRTSSGGGSSNLTLDDLTASPILAISTRKLDKDYTGYCMRVRRSNDNAEQDIGFTSGGDLDTSSLTSFCGSNSGYVTTWYDQSGNTRNLTMTTTANQPRIVNAGTVETSGDVGGKAGIAFSTGSYWMSLSYTISLTTLTVAMVVDLDASGSRIFDHYTGANDYTSGNLSLYNSSNKFACYSGAARAISTNTVTGSAKSIVFRRDGANSVVYDNNSAGTTDTSWGTTTLTGETLRLGNATSAAWLGHYYEFIYFGSAISSTDRTTIYDDVVSYFGIN